MKHTCDGPEVKKSTNRHRICRIGAGVEETKGKCNTEGFPLISEPRIVKDVRGFKKLEMPRNHPRVIQSSMSLVQSWHANCDVQFLIYDSDPLCPDPSDIARVTDYVVAYACKGNDTLIEEKKHIKSLILG